MTRYIALTDSTLAATESVPQLQATLSALGLDVQLRVQGFTIFADGQMPALHLPGGAVVLGELYDQQGKRVVATGGLQHIEDREALRRRLLEQHWGQYILIQPVGQDTGQAATFLRDPSGGVGCAYSLAHGFVTSDVSLPSQLGLYHPNIDWEFVEHCLNYSHGKISRTGLAHVRELMPGHMLEMAPGSARTSTAWSPWQFVSAAEQLNDPAVAAQAVRSAVTMVVRAMAKTDQSLLLQLSGGLDSSILGVSLKGAQARIFACTTLSPLPGADERPYARQISARLGIELLEAQLDLTQPGIEFPLPSQALRPAVSPLAYAASRAMDVEADRQQVNAIYSGGGGDTVFGYLKTAAPAADAYRYAGLGAGWRSTLDLTKLHGCTLVKALQLTLRKLLRSPSPAYQQDCRLLHHPRDTPLEVHPWLQAPSDALPGQRERIFELAGNQMFAEVMLRRDDKRVRMPLLSQPVMEACLRVPSWLWIAGGRNRAIARAAFSDLLPAEIVNRRSKGSFMNYNASLYRRHKNTMRRFLLDGRLNAHGLLDAEELVTYMDRPLGSRDQSFLRIFDLCVVENWVRQHD